MVIGTEPDAQMLEEEIRLLRDIVNREKQEKAGLQTRVCQLRQQLSNARERIAELECLPPQKNGS